MFTQELRNKIPNTGIKNLLVFILMSLNSAFQFTLARLSELHHRASGLEQWRKYFPSASILDQGSDRSRDLKFSSVPRRRDLVPIASDCHRDYRREHILSHYCRGATLFG